MKQLSVDSAQGGSFGLAVATSGGTAKLDVELPYSFGSMRRRLPYWPQSVRQEVGEPAEHFPPGGRSGEATVQTNIEDERSSRSVAERPKVANKRCFGKKKVGRKTPNFT